MFLVFWFIFPISYVKELGHKAFMNESRRSLREKLTLGRSVE